MKACRMISFGNLRRLKNKKLSAYPVVVGNAENYFNTTVASIALMSGLSFSHFLQDSI